MKRFAIHYYSKTCASIADRKAQQAAPFPAWKFTFQGSGFAVSISDLLKVEAGANLHWGLRLIVDVQAESEDEVEEIAQGHCELILNFVTLATQASCLAAKLQGTIEITDQASFPFVSISYPFEDSKIETHPLRKIKEEVFNEIFRGFTAHPEGRQRIHRALSWLRKGLNETDQTDEFVSYWVGIEVISSLLRDKIKMKVKDPGPWAGIEDIFTRKLRVTNFADIKSARDELLHGYRELNTSFITQVRSYRESTRKALILGISDLLGISAEVENQILAEQPLKAGGRAWVVTRGKMSGIPTDFDELTSNFPHVQTDYVTQKSQLTTEGKVQQQVVVNHRYVGPPDGKWSVESVELRGDSDTGIESGGIELSNMTSSGGKTTIEPIKKTS